MVRKPPVLNYTFGVVTIKSTLLKPASFQVSMTAHVKKKKQRK
jgi:hypothetical protein